MSNQYRKNLETSFEEGDNVDTSKVIAEVQETQFDLVNPSIHTRNLSEVFDSCVKSSENHMKVFLRVRPSNKQDNTIVIDPTSTSIITTAPDSSKRAQYTKLEERHYSFNKVFGPNSNQTEVFDEVVSPLLDRFMEGESCVLLAYGMTNAGKTYTIQGNSQNPGILPRIVEKILLSNSRDNTTELHLSMLEIYQEKIFDLQVKRKDKLTIRDGSGRVEISKLTSNTVKSQAEAIKLLDIAATNRSKSHTLLNTGSSRSHAVYTLTLCKINSKDINSVFHIVDLAGAERGNRTKATSAQQKEANNINVSLMQLWRCLQGMKRKTSEGNGLDLIPYRESKLTHLLMPEIGRAGLQGVAMVTCVNPQNDDYDETISILGNASIACKIKEIVDVSRPPPATSTQSYFQSALSTVFSVATGTNNNDKQVIDKTTKRKRTAENVNDHTMKRSSVHTTKSNLSSTSLELSNDELPEIKKLKLQVNELLNENHNLKINLLTRETELREEISIEMSKRSNKLLLQIQTLQQQINNKKNKLSIDSNNSDNNNNINYLIRSCKKEKRKYLDIQNNKTYDDLKYIEEEYEKMKLFYENEILLLNNNNNNILNELNELKNNYNNLLYKYNNLQNELIINISPNNKEKEKEKSPSNMKRSQSPTISSNNKSRSPLNSIKPFNNTSNIIINEDINNYIIQKSHSPVRSLSPSTRYNLTSDVMKKTTKNIIINNNNENSGIITNKNLNDNNSNDTSNTYFKRLRSHLNNKV